MNFTAIACARLQSGYALPPGRPGNALWQSAETPPKKRGILSEQTRPPLRFTTARPTPFTPPDSTSSISRSEKIQSASSKKTATARKTNRCLDQSAAQNGK